MPAAAVQRKAVAVRTREFGRLSSWKLSRDCSKWWWFLAPTLAVNRFLKVFEGRALRSMEDVRDPISYGFHARACSYCKAIGQDRRILHDFLSVNLVPNRQDDCPPRGRFALREPIEFPLWPLLCEELPAEHYDAESAGFEPLVDLASQAVAYV